MRTIETIYHHDHPTSVVTWLINDPASHPAWTQYIGLIVSLHDAEGYPPAVKYGDYTHEYHLWAIHPSKVVTRDLLVQEFDMGGFVLNPPNHVYQFKAESNLAAEQFVKGLLETAPSLDTDFDSWWDKAFAEGHSLKRSVFNTYKPEGEKR